MIDLHRTRTRDGEVSVALNRIDGAVVYIKNGEFQTMVDATGRNLAPHIDAAVDLLKKEGAQRALVLGHGGGAASSMLHRLGIDVVAVDRDARAEGLSRLFFRAPPSLEVVVEDAAAFVSRAAPASFDGVFVDFQESAVTPVAYLSEVFWRSLTRALRAPRVVVMNVPPQLYRGDDWPSVRRVLTDAGLGSAALSDPFEFGNRLLLTLAHPAEAGSYHPMAL